MKIYNDFSICNALKNAASEKSISKSDLENLRASITYIYNSEISSVTLSKEQKTNAIYQIEKDGTAKDFTPSKIDK